MPSIAVKDLFIICRLHRRHQYLDEIFTQIKCLARGRKVHVVYMYDRVTQGVVRTIAKIVRGAPSNIHFTHRQAAVPILSSNGQRWKQSLIEAHAYGRDSDAGIVWDDDVTFDELALKEMRGHLRFLEVDRIEVLWNQLWDNRSTINTRFPEHYAACLYRIADGDDFSKDFEAHYPQKCAQSSEVIRLKGRLNHFGYLTEQDRKDSFAALKAAGKLDPHTLTLVVEPKLEKLHGC